MVAAEPGRAQRVPEQQLDLGVDAAQVVVGPATQGREDHRIETDEEGVATRHDVDPDHGGGKRKAGGGRPRRQL